MHKRVFTLILILGASGLIAASIRALPPTAQAARPEVFASPINAGCTRVTDNRCKLNVDPFTIQVASGQTLQAFQLWANGSVMYDFRSDVSNPPPGSYTPSSVKQGFAATCGATYTLNLVARDSGDSGFLNAGQVENIICPDPVEHRLFLPAILTLPAIP